MRDDITPPLTARLLLEAYVAGIFPMADGAEARDVFWVDPQLRGILPLDGLHVSRSLRKRIRQGGFEIRVNSRFAEVLDACADREETWINRQIFSLYMDLHRTGYAHSVEVWMDGKLVGGLYGVALGGAFFGESMFSRRPDASKIALVWLVARLRAGGFTLLDTQFVTDHLESMGAVEITRAEYQRRLDKALRRPADFWRLPLSTDAQSVVQLSTQTS
ncbi:leucyl/phenylalanyl-tRNA--protein transferase [Halovulum dunhuangense]|uniref:Leucyl/phenylalanyl-tRNA--protein transferase n=1 Tax=Halovulum dunhuangense TaxID=1505036 RepID=A0A849L2V6_9RHOB|nr:leucyl/phenylalanyl-tRNA--protein transferase [Halovulum dunhuangense]NNU80666.1 leucyl/phenylalanyl-tRNA--protein transferase [Halovulum dunhuangense]